MEDDNYICLDCGLNTLEISEYYMVTDFVWSKTNVGKYDGMLCIGCLEARIGFILNKDHFTNVPLNTSSVIKRSKRLNSRINSGHKRNTSTIISSFRKKS